MQKYRWMSAQPLRTGVLAGIASACFACAAAAEPAAPPSATEGCDGVRLDVSDSLAPAWRDAASALRSDLVASEAPCVSALLTLAPAANDAALLTVTTTDGRHADRLVSKPAALVSAALGLVATLPPDKTTPANVAPASSSATTQPGPEGRADADTDAPADRSSSKMHLWVGAGIGGRIAEPTLLGMIDIQGRITLEMNHWLLFGAVRYGTSMGESLVSADDSYDEIAASIGLGRTLELGASTFELALVPSIVSADLSDDDEQDGTASARTELRLGGLLGWSYATEDGWRMTLTADGDIAPRGIDRPVRSAPNDPPLPVWTAGLRLGAAGRLL